MQSFKFYPTNYLGSSEIRQLSLEEECCYFRMLITLYDEDGKVEHNLHKFCAIFRIKTTKRCAKVWQKIEKFFEVSDGWVTHAKVTEEIIKHEEISSKCSAGGRKAMRKRWAKCKPPYDSVITKTINKKQETIDKREEEQPPAPESDFQFHSDTKECFDAWVDFIGLGPHHTSGFFQDRNMRDMDASVVVHGKAKVIQCLTSKKVKYPKMVLCQLDKDEADKVSTEIEKRPEGFYEEIEQMSL
tara:strand:- start:2123 stop:2851 length:729 start_codon:yes stop_codon:yes gene_type:complete